VFSILVKVLQNYVVHHSCVFLSTLTYGRERKLVERRRPKGSGSKNDTVGHRHWRRHEELVRLHIKPAIGSVKLDRLSPLQLQSLYSSKLNAGLSPETVHKIHACLGKALRHAVRWQLIPRAATESVDPPRVPRAEITVLTVEQMKGLLKAAEGNKLYAVYVVAATTALREGELREVLIFCTLALLGGGLLVLVLLADVDWFFPALFYGIVDFFPWQKYL
jgi:integrase